VFLRFVVDAEWIEIFSDRGIDFEVWFVRLGGMAFGNRKRRLAGAGVVAIGVGIFPW
jgi:hypothetical protein